MRNLIRSQDKGENEKEHENVDDFPRCFPA